MITHQNAGPGAPARVVLLGGHGFIGNALRAELGAQRIPTIAPTSAELNLTNTSAASRLAELIGPGDAVVMLAVLAPDRGRDIATLMKNLAMMENVCGALARASCAHFVYFSSDAVYAPQLTRVDDETLASPQDLYGTMHHTREIMARHAVKAPLLILRPTLVYGGGDTHNSYGPNRFRRAAQRDGRIDLFGEGEDKRDHVHVQDVAALTVRCLLRRSVGVLNVASGASTTFRELALLVAEQFEKKIELGRLPRQAPVTHRHYDVTDLIKAFPDFRCTALEEGIARVHGETDGDR